MPERRIADLREGWRLSSGLLTALPRRRHATGVVSPAVARTAILVAPLVVVPLGVAVAALLWLAGRLDLPPLAAGLLAVGALALGTRALHWDGLSDVADGLTASYDRERSLAVMKTGTSGPAGTLAVVLVAGLQGAGFGALVDHPLWAGLAVCLARCALWLVCAAPVPAARPDGPDGGIGGTFTRSVPVPVAALGALLTGVLPALVVVALVARCTRRLGGVTGDVMGAAVELCLVTLLLGLACL